MWTSIALVTALSLAPGQAGQLTLTNAHPTYGSNGATRPDTKFLPGDIFILTFDVANLKADDTGKVAYSMGMEMTDSKGKLQYKSEPEDRDAVNSLGGTGQRVEAHAEIGIDTPPGEYTLKVTVADRATKESQTLTQAFEVLPPALGFLRVHLTHEFPGTSFASPLGVLGQMFGVSCFVSGFKRNEKNEPSLTVEMQIFDDAGRPTVAKPMAVEAPKDFPKTEKVFPAPGPLQFPLALSRAGKYTVKLKVTDNVAKTSEEVSLPLTVVDLK